jgi:hypothetical protein
MSSIKPNVPGTGTRHYGRGAIGATAGTAAVATGEHHRHGNGDAEAHDCQRSHVPEWWSC